MIWLAVFFVMLLFVLMMSIGVLMGRKPIAGSCGGIANLGIEKECSICGGNREKCEEVQQERNGIVLDEDLVQNIMPANKNK